MIIRNRAVMAMAARAFAGSAAAVALTAATSTAAGSITVANASFETLPASGLPFALCGGTCDYSFSSYAPTSIPGWTATGAYGQWQPGPPNDTTYFNSIPDGSTVAFAYGGSISQTVGTRAVAGVTYTLNVEVGFRKDVPELHTEALDIGGVTVLATGASLPFSGNWADWTASYTATAADAGAPIAIVLTSTTERGNWDNVSLASSAAPEPGAWMLLLLGVGAVGAAARNRQAQSSPRTSR